MAIRADWFNNHHCCGMCRILRYKYHESGSVEHHRTAQANGTALPTPKAATSNKTVFLIMMENHNWSDIKNNPSAPFINNTLLPMASYQLAFRVI